MNSTDRLQEILEAGLPYMSSPNRPYGEVIAIFDDGIPEIINKHPRSLIWFIESNNAFWDGLNDVPDTLRHKGICISPGSRSYSILAAAAGVDRFARDLKITYNKYSTSQYYISDDLEIHGIPGKHRAHHYFLMPSRKLLAEPLKFNMPNDGPYR